VEGTGANPVFNGEYLAQQNVVVVTFNYRRKSSFRFKNLLQLVFLGGWMEEVGSPPSTWVFRIQFWH